jgi:hypothetical protein
VLHITNGDSAAGVMREAGIAGEILPWRDVLHEGPVPANLPLEELSQVRAEFIAECGWAAHDTVIAQFRQRDAVLATFRDHEEVILWFEHDLYDQLQLLQLLDFFCGRDLGSTPLSLICIDEYLGTLSPDRMAALQGTQQPVRREQLDLGRRAWSAFRAPEPAAWNALLDEDTSGLRFLAGAVLRHLEEYPSVENGLNRTEAQLLKGVRAGIHDRVGIFQATQRMEERIFMGDTSFWTYLDAMVQSRPPLLTRVGQEIYANAAAEQVMRNEDDWIAISGLDKWLGGVHLTHERHWRWDRAKRQLVSSAER